MKMSMKKSSERAKPTNYCLPAGNGAVSDKAGKLGTAIEQVFQQHQEKFGSKTLMSIAYSQRS
jgi:hypothetical protein